MTPKQIRDALTETSDYAKQMGRPNRYRFVLSPGTIIDSDACTMEGGVLRVIDTNQSILFIDPLSVILIANALLPPPAEAQIDVQGGELDIPRQ